MQPIYQFTSITQTQIVTAIGTYYDGVYAAVDHNHNDEYAPLLHNHDSLYAAISHSHDGAAITTGLVSPARLGSGTRDGTRFLRDDGTWQIVAGGGGTWGSITGTLSNQTDVSNAINARLALSGGTMTGAILLPDGTTSTPSLAFSAQTNSGMWRDPSGINISHLGTQVADFRNSGLFFRVNLIPATDSARQIGLFNLRPARITSVQYRSALNSGNGYLFDDGSGNLINSGIYAISTTTVGLNLNGSSILTGTSSGITLQTGSLGLPSYTSGTAPLASAHTSRLVTIDGVTHQSNGTQWLSLVNSTDSFLLNRANHTGTQDQSTITNLVSDLAGKSSVGHTHAKSDVGLGNVDNTSDADKPISTLTQSALDAKQATLVSGTNIKTVNGSSILGSGGLVFGTPTLTSLPSDANVTLAAGNLYHGSIAGYTANRNLTVPSGTAGDEITILITTGSNTFSAIIIGAAGVSINSGAAATEWSRLFITNECVVLKCISSNNWRVVYDGRIPQHYEMRLASDVSSHFVNDAVTKNPLDTIVTNVGGGCDTTNDWVMVRRSGIYLPSAHQLVDGISTSSIQVIGFLYNGTQLKRGSWTTRSDTGVSGAVAFCSPGPVYSAAGTAIYGATYQNNGAALTADSTTEPIRYSFLSVVEIL